MTEEWTVPSRTPGDRIVHIIAEAGAEMGGDAVPEFYQALFQALGEEGANLFLTDLVDCWEHYDKKDMPKE